MVRNDAVTVEEALALQPQRIVISPGPGRPEQAGITLALIGAWAGKVPILGVCLGLQAIGLHFGARVVHAPEIVHGRTSAVTHEGKGLFKGLPSPLTVTRYHSLCLDPANLPPCLEVTARTQDGTIMAARHRDLAIDGVQFHPEAVLTEHGHTMLRTWLQSSTPANRA